MNRKQDEPSQPPTEESHSDHLSALGRLVERAFPDATELFNHGLALLVQQLGVDRAVMTRLTDLGYEAFWWATAEGILPDAAIHDPGHGFCPRVLDSPSRTLVIKDANLEAQWKTHPGWTRLGIRAYIGAPLRQTGKIIGVLDVQCGRPKAWTRAEIAMVNAVANLFSKTMEVETLKHELRLTRDALDLTTAVVEDSALECPGTGLPNTHYLEIWLKANLFLARRRMEAMSVVRWDLEVTPENRKHMRDVAEALRGEDLLVDLGRERFLMLLPRTPKTGADILLDRIRERIGPVPMGATLWDPMTDLDRDDLAIRNAMDRSNVALHQSCMSARNGSGNVVWNVPEPSQAEIG